MLLLALVLFIISLGLGVKLVYRYKTVSTVSSIESNSLVNTTTQESDILKNLIPSPSLLINHQLPHFTQPTFIISNSLEPCFAAYELWQILQDQGFILSQQGLSFHHTDKAIQLFFKPLPDLIENIGAWRVQQLILLADNFALGQTVAQQLADALSAEVKYEQPN